MLMLQQKESLAAEKKRLDEERQKREVMRRKQELQEIEKKQAMDKIAALKKTSVGAKALKDLTEEVIGCFVFSVTLHNFFSLGGTCVLPELFHYFHQTNYKVGQTSTIKAFYPKQNPLEYRKIVNYTYVSPGFANGYEDTVKETEVDGTVVSFMNRKLKPWMQMISWPDKLNNLTRRRKNCR